MTPSEQGLDNIMRIISANKMLGDRELTPIRKAIKIYGDLRVCERLGEEIEKPDNVVKFTNRYDAEGLERLKKHEAEVHALNVKAYGTFEEIL